MPDTRTATFLFTDLEGSTRLLERIGDEYAEVLGEHWRILREAALDAGGEEFGAEGDAMFFAFDSASAAATAAVEAQAALLRHPWPEGIGVKVRMGLHSGSARVVFGQWVGLALHHAARICAAGHGGQILVSPVTTQLLAVERPAGIRVESLGEYHLRDVTGPQELGQVEFAGLDSEFPPLRTPMAAVTNLPNSLTTFVGRSAEITDVRRLMRRTRLLTLTGSGGAGKTRLAYEAAGDAGPDFEDGVWVAELATATESSGVHRAVAAAVGAVLDPTVDDDAAHAQLVAHLRTKQLLLVLDNCEQVVDAVAAMADAVLRACPRLHLLATSREVLRVPGEQVWPIPPMGEAAVRLFADRAVLARPTFEVTPANEAAVRRICERLDELPLAIELAAARVSSLSVDQIELRLDDRFQLLGQGSRTANPRQQTLRAVVDWSHDLLDAEEQVLFRRLAVFAGSFPADRAAAVVDGDVGDVEDALAQFVAKSLLVMEGGAGEVRYRYLETVRDYAADRLEESGEATTIHDAHLGAVASFVADAATRILGPEQREWLDRLDAEWPDLRRALGRALETDPTTAIDAAGALGPFFAIRGHVGEGRSILEAALPIVAAPASRTADPLGWWARVRALAAAGTLARAVGLLDVARRHHGEQLELVRDDPDEELTAKALSSLGNVVLLEGDLVEARRLCEESLVIRRRLGAPRPIAMALNNLGVLADCEGDFEAAEAAYLEHLGIMREVGDDRVVGQTLTNLALVHLGGGRLDEAAVALDESLALLRSVGDSRSEAITMAAQAGLFRDRGDLEGALHQYGGSLRVLDDLGDPAGVGMAIDGIVTILAGSDSRDHLHLAARLLGASSRLPIGPGERGRVEEDAVERAAAITRDALGDAAFDAAFGAGREADLSTIVNEALAFAAGPASDVVRSTSTAPRRAGEDPTGSGS